MRLTSKKVGGPVKPELSMTSMIDVVFLLLIFFMVTTSVVLSERQLRPAIQVDEETTSQAPSDLDPAIVEVVSSNGRFVYRLGANEFTDPGRLVETLRAFDNKYDGAFVRVADDAPFDMSATALQACRAAGFPAVSYVPLD